MFPQQSYFDRHFFQILYFPGLTFTFKSPLLVLTIFEPVVVVFWRFVKIMKSKIVDQMYEKLKIE